MQMVDAQHRIEQLTGRSVDMVTRLRPRIYAEAEPDMVEPAAMKARLTISL